MSPVRGLTSAMQPFSRRRGSKPLTAADTERLLAGRGVHPEAPAVQHALAGLLDSAAGPASGQELAGEAVAVAVFVLATGEHAARSAQFRARARRGPAIAVGIAAAAVVAFSGAAAADALPAPIQELAHTTFGAPAPRHPAPLPKATLPSSQPAPAASPSPKSQHGKAKALGKKASPSGSARGKAKGKAVPPGHQKPEPAATGQEKNWVPAVPGRSRTHVAWRLLSQSRWVRSYGDRTETSSGSVAAGVLQPRSAPTRVRFSLDGTDGRCDPGTGVLVHSDSRHAFYSG